MSPPVVHLVTFSYNRGRQSGGTAGFNPAQPVGSAARQLYWLCSQVCCECVESSASPRLLLRRVIFFCGIYGTDIFFAKESVISYDRKR